MSTITPLTSTDGITAANSMVKINTNFDNLNIDKIETSVLDTDTALTANSDSKVATQKAVKAYVDAGGNVNASTTTKGIVEEATQAEVDAGTAAGGTGARLFVNPSTLPRALTLVPLPTFPHGSGVEDPTKTLSFATNTSAYVTQVVVPFGITVNKVSVYASAVAVAGTIDLSMYSEDGQTQIFSVTTASISGAGVVTTAVSSVAVPAGIYYIMTNTNSTTSVTLHTWYAADSAFSTTTLLGGVTTEPDLNGVVTITAGTPAAFTPSSGITAGLYGSAAFRLDN